MKTLTHRTTWLLKPVLGFSLLLGMAGFYGSSPASNTGTGARTGTPVRLAHFPNVTHAPALVGVAKGFFQQELGNSPLSVKVVAAGPEAMEALLAGAIDVAYTGPGPAINTFIKSHGKALRVISGACEGGASLVAVSTANVQAVRDLNGKRVAVPSLGSTQDISLRYFLAQAGLSTKDKGGTVEVLAIKPADTLSLMKSGQLDAAWMPEPWTSRLIAEAGAKLIVEERNLWKPQTFVATVIVARTDFIQNHPDLVAAIERGHRASVAWIAGNAVEASPVINAELKRLTGKPLKESVLKSALSRVTFVNEVSAESLKRQTQMGIETGYLPLGADVSGIAGK